MQNGLAGAQAGGGVRVIWDDAVLIKNKRVGTQVVLKALEGRFPYLEYFILKTGEIPKYKLYLVDYNDQELCKMVFIL